jgi:hypothetical protein
MAKQTKTLHEILATIQTDLKVQKSRRNKFGNYNYRSAEDILEALKPYIEKYGVTFKTTEKDISDQFVQKIETTATISNGIDEIPATAIVGIDINQKGMATPQQFGSASSYGKKYAYGNLLLIDDTADADAINNGQYSNQLSDSQLKQILKLSKPEALRAVKGYDLTPQQKNILNQNFNS